MPADHPDTLIAATAREHGATVGSAGDQFWRDTVSDVLAVAEHDPC